MTTIRRRILTTVLTMVAALMFGILPASANVPAAVNCTGVANVAPGLSLPIVYHAEAFTWDIGGPCLGSATGFTASGTGTGWCGHSIGVGQGNFSGVAGKAGGINFLVNWTSAGSVLFVHGTQGTPLTANSHDGGGLGRYVGVVNARGGADCTSDSGANTFNVDFVAAAV